MIQSNRLTRLKWRFGRKLYMAARGEQRVGSIEHNGEAFALRSMLKSTSTIDPLVVFDIGANQGEWTENLLRGLPTERLGQDRLAVHAFEPVPGTAELFRDRIAGLPGQEAVSLHNCAVSDAEGRATIGVYAVGAGTNSLHFDQDIRPTQTTIEVDLTSLDKFCEMQKIDHIHFVKCDTEGHDAKVIRGAQKTIQSGRIDVLQFEYNHRWVLGRAFLKDIFDLIEGLPYSLARVDETHLTVFDGWHQELDRFFQSNYILVHERAEPWFNMYRGRFDQANTYA